MLLKIAEVVFFILTGLWFLGVHFSYQEIIMGASAILIGFLLLV